MVLPVNSHVKRMLYEGVAVNSHVGKGCLGTAREQPCEAHVCEGDAVNSHGCKGYMHVLRTIAAVKLIM